jgi:hypothetical protein
MPTLRALLISAIGVRTFVRVDASEDGGLPVNPRCPTDRLTTAEAQRLGDLVDARGESAAIKAVGLRSPETFYKAMARRPVMVMTAEVIRGRLDRI